MLTAPEDDFSDVELRQLVDAIFLKYGCDFRHYARTSFRRRIRHVLAKSNLPSIRRLHERVHEDAAFFHSILADLTITVTAMFRQPSFYAAFRKIVLPFLSTYPRLKVWIAGCASGEEAYSVAMVLHEEGLLDRSLIYATDLNPASIAQAREGIYPAQKIRGHAENYHASGGRESFSNYFTVAHGYAAIAPSLKRNMTFAEHNLVSDEVFGEMHVILCRNVLIYFDRTLKEHTLALLNNSLIRGGFLCLGRTETLGGTPSDRDFIETEPGNSIYRKKMPA